MVTTKSHEGSRVYTRSALAAIRGHRAAVLEPNLYLDLLQTGYGDGARIGDGSGLLDCLGLALEVVRRQGYAVTDPTPDIAYDPKKSGALIARGLRADSWQEIDEPVAGCVVALRKKADGHGHLGVYLGGSPASVLHSIEVVGVSVIRLSTFKGIADEGGVRYYVPHEALHVPTTGDRLPATIVSPTPEKSQEGPILAAPVVGYRVLVVPDPVFAPANRTARFIPYREGMTVADVLDETGFPFGSLMVPRLGREPLSADSLLPFPSADEGDVILVLGVEWKGTSFLIALAVALIVSAISTVLQLLLAPQLEGSEGPAETASPTFDLSGLRNTTRPGLPIGVMYGEHRVAGQICQASFTVDGAGRSVLYVLVSLGAGPIESIGGLTEDTVFPLSGSAIPDGFEIDGNPASSFECEVQVRLGSNGQEPIHGFDDVIVNVPYNYTLLVGQPFEHFTQDPVEAFEVLLFYPEGLVEIDDGDYDPWTTVHEITYEPVDGSAAPVTISRSLTKATRVSFSDRVARVDGLPLKNYKITVERISPPWPNFGDADPAYFTKSVLSAVNEITYDQLAYPETALIAWKIVASEQVSGGIPTLTSTAKGRKVWVWDGVSETNPNFGTAPVWTDIPAWIVLDMILHPIYGGGRGGEFTLDDIDLQSFKDWADHTETLVDDGRGGTFERGKCDTIFDTDTPMWDGLQGIAASNWANIVPLGRRIMIVVDKARSPVAVFGRSNTRDFIVRYLGKRVRMNGVDVDFFNEEEDYEADTETRTDDTSIFTNNEPERRERISALGVTRPAHAARLAQFKLNRHRQITKQGEFKCGIEGIHLLPGDVIQVAHENLSWDQSGRVQADSAFTQRFEINEFITTDAATDKVAFVYIDSNGDEVFYEGTIANGAGSWSPGDSLFFSPSLPNAGIKKGAAFLVGKVGTYARYAKITSIVTDPDMTRTIRWEEYPDGDTVYDDDPGDVAVATPRLPHGKDLGDAVTFEVTERNFPSKTGQWKDAIQITVTGKNRDWEENEVFIAPISDLREDSGPLPWRSVGCFKGESMILHDEVKRCITYAVSVVPVSPSGVSLRPDRIIAKYVRINGSRIEPPSLADLSWKGTQDEFGDARLEWSEGFYQIAITAEAWSDDWEFIECRHGTRWAGAHIMSRMYGPGLHKLHDYFPQSGSGAWAERGPEFVFRAKGKNGMWSYPHQETAPIPVTPAPANYSADGVQAYPTWKGSGSSVAISGSFIELTGSNVSGYWRLASKTATLDKLLLCLAIQSQIESENMQWQESNHKWGSEKAQREAWNSWILDGDECREPVTWESADMEWDSLIPDVLDWRDWDENRHSRIMSPRLLAETKNGTITSVGEPYTNIFRNVNEWRAIIEFQRPPSTRYNPQGEKMGGELQERN